MIDVLDWRAKGRQFKLDLLHQWQFADSKQCLCCVGSKRIVASAKVFEFGFYLPILKITITIAALEMTLAIN